MARTRTWVRAAMMLEVLVELPLNPPSPGTPGEARMLAAAEAKLREAMQQANKVLAAGVDANSLLRRQGVEAPTGAVVLSLSPTGAVSMMQISNAEILAVYDTAAAALRDRVVVPEPEPDVKAGEVAARQGQDTVGLPLIEELMTQAGAGRRGVLLNFPMPEAAVETEEDTQGDEPDAA